MRYVGGKSRIARQIVDVIASRTDATYAIEPFMGGGAVTAYLADRFDIVAANDAHEDIALLWQAVLDGWRPPEMVTEREYQELRNAPPSALRGFVGSGGSFGGKWFGGYARGGRLASGAHRNHQGESARAVDRIGRHLRAGSVTVTAGDYQDVVIPPGSVVYCDPPYAGTQGYASGDFDHVEFWAWAEIMSDDSDVFVSEYRAPSWWNCIWSAEKRQSITLPSQGREMRVERLFSLKP